jgi:hypothetical protein
MGFEPHRYHVSSLCLHIAAFLALCIRHRTPEEHTLSRLADNDLGILERTERYAVATIDVNENP